MDNKYMVEYFFSVEGSPKLGSNDLLEEILNNQKEEINEHDYNAHRVTLNHIKRTIRIDYEFKSQYDATMTFIEFINIIVELNAIKPLPEKLMKELEAKQKEAEKNGDK